MSNDFFLKLDGIQGESRDQDHANEIDIDGWSFGVNEQDDGNDARKGRSSGGRDNLPVFRQGGDAAAYGQNLTGSVLVSDIRLVKKMDAASTALMKASTTRQKIAKAVLTCRKASGGSDPLEYLVVNLQDVMVSRWQVKADESQADPLPSESLVLSYTRIELVYQPQGKSGSSEGKKQAGWERKLNAAM